MDDNLRSQLRLLVPLPTGLVPSGRIHGPIRAILFDIYGTLFVSGSGDIGVAENQFRQSDALDALRARCRIPWSSAQMARKLFAAIRHAHTQKKALGVDHPEVKIDHIWQGILGWSRMARVRRLAEAYEYIVNPTYPMPGLDQVLRTLRGRGILMGVISNAQFFTPQLFTTFLGATPEQLGFAADLSLYSFRFGCAKPSMMLFDHAVKRLQKWQVSPESVLYVGNDMRNDIRPASQAGFQTALFAGDRRSLRQHNDDPALRGMFPDLLITDLRQLLEVEMQAMHPRA